MSDGWDALAKAQPKRLAELFSAEPDRLSCLVVEEAGIRFDFSKTHLDTSIVSDFCDLAKTQGLAEARDSLFSGATINVTEGRAVEHTAERGQGSPDSVQRAQGFHARMRALVDAIEAGAFGEIRSILHIGIGGSALGPDFVVDALGRDPGRYQLAVFSNVD